MHLSIIFCLLFSMTAWGADENAQVKEVFARYQKMHSEAKKDLVPQVFSEKYLADRGGESEVKASITKMPVPAYDLDIKPGAMSKDVKIVKMIPKGHKGHVQNLFILKRRPSGEWRIDGTMSNDD